MVKYKLHDCKILLQQQFIQATNGPMQKRFSLLSNEKETVKYLGPYAKKGKEGKVRTARKGWRGKSLL